jgi:hypothetical protein
MPNPAIKFYVQGAGAEQAAQDLSRSHEILLKLGRLDGIAMVGVYLGQLLYAHDSEQGMEILSRSMDGFQRLGMVDWAKQVKELIDELKSKDRQVYRQPACPVR